MLKVAFASAALVALLAACTPADAELDGDLEVNGMDPAFWGVKVARAQNSTTIAVLGERDIAGELPVKSKGPGNAVLMTSRTPEGDFVMTLHQEACKDGLGERAYNWSVTVDWKGEMLTGCAAPAAFGPAPAAG